MRETTLYFLVAIAFSQLIMGHPCSQIWWSKACNVTANYGFFDYVEAIKIVISHQSASPVLIINRTDTYGSSFIGISNTDDYWIFGIDAGQTGHPIVLKNMNTGVWALKVTDDSVDIGVGLDNMKSVNLNLGDGNNYAATIHFRGSAQPHIGRIIVHGASLAIFLDAENTRTDSSFDIYKDAESFSGNQVKLFSIDEGGNVWAKGVLKSNSDPGYAPAAELRTWGLNKPDGHLYIEWGKDSGDALYITDHWRYSSPVYIRAGTIYLQPGNNNVMAISSSKIDIGVWGATFDTAWSGKPSITFPSGSNHELRIHSSGSGYYTNVYIDGNLILPEDNRYIKVDKVYDRDDDNYYVDPAGISYLKEVKASSMIYSSGYAYYYYPYAYVIQVNQPGSTSSTGWSVVDYSDFFIRKFFPGGTLKLTVHYRINPQGSKCYYAIKCGSEYYCQTEDSTNGWTWKEISCSIPSSYIGCIIVMKSSSSFHTCKFAAATIYVYSIK